MTSIFSLLDSQSYPGDPTGPTQAPAGYVTPNQPDPNKVGAPMSHEQLLARRTQFYEFIIQRLVQAFLGFIPGGAQATSILDQWGLDLENILGLPGLGTGSVNPLTWATDFIQNRLDPTGLISSVSSIVEALTGIGGSNDIFDIQNNGILGINVPDLLGSWTDIFEGITGIDFDGSDRSRQEMRSAVESQSDSVTGTAAELLQIKAALGAGTPDADDFERAALGANWGVYYLNAGAGSWGIVDGHNAGWTGQNDNQFVARKLDKQAAGDNQIVEMTLNTSASSVRALILLALAEVEWADNDLWLRMSPFTTYATRTGIRARFSAQDWIRLSAFDNGTELWGVQVNHAQPQGGSNIGLRAGVDGNPRKFAVTINGLPVLSHTEVGTASLIGSGYRYRGHGGRSEQSPLNLQTAMPGQVRQWAAQG